jgi:hypothetical protein
MGARVLGGGDGEHLGLRWGMAQTQTLEKKERRKEMWWTRSCAVAGKEASRLQQVKIRTSFCSEMGHLVFSAGFPSTPTKVIYQNLHVSEVANIVTVHFPC